MQKQKSYSEKFQNHICLPIETEWEFYQCFMNVCFSVAQFDAGLSPRMISPTPADEDKEG